MTNQIFPSRETLISVPVGDYTVAQIVRILAGDTAAHPVEIVDGSASPSMEGEGFYWTTPGGRPIQYPNAYKWAKVYHPSSIRVSVGLGWVLDMLARQTDGGAFRKDTRHGVTAAVLCGQRRMLHGYRVELAETQQARIWLITGPSGRGYQALRTVGMFADAAALDEDARRAVRSALHAWQAQRAADRAWANTLGRPIDAIWVDADASIRSGNCPAGTDAMASRVRAVVGPVSAVRADVLLSLRDDAFTRRAITASAKRAA